MFLFDLFQRAPLVALMVAAVLLYSLALHELGHAWVAERMGDPTARNLGRITLNPLKHLDPVGTVLLLFAGFGWAKPVPIKPQNFRDYRMGLFWVSIAGVAVNFALALLALVILASLGVRVDAAGRPTGITSIWEIGLFISAQINILLAVFNLIPVPPLDGSKVLQAFLPKSMQKGMWQLERYGFFLVVILIVVFREQVFGLINGVTAALMRLFMGGA